MVLQYRETIAEPIRGPQILKAVEDSGGIFLEVEEEEIKKLHMYTILQGLLLQYQLIHLFFKNAKYAKNINSVIFPNHVEPIF